MLRSIENEVTKGKLLLGAAIAVGLSIVVPALAPEAAPPINKQISQGFAADKHTKILPRSH